MSSRGGGAGAVGVSKAAKPVKPVKGKLTPLAAFVSPPPVPFMFQRYVALVLNASVLYPSPDPTQQQSSKSMIEDQSSFVLLLPLVGVHESSVLANRTSASKDSPLCCCCLDLLTYHPNPNPNPKSLIKGTDQTT